MQQKNNKLINFSSSLGLLCLLTPMAVVAQTALSPAYFDYQAPLIGGESSLRQVDLPQQVLARIQRHDLGDLRVFNDKNKIVPHQFSYPTADKRLQNEDLVFYPFSQQQANNPSEIRIKIEQQQGSQNIITNTHTTPSKLKERDEFQYIIENKLSHLDDKPQLCRLKLVWEQPKPSMIIPLQLQSSNDLQQWVNLGGRKNISKLNYGDSQLVRSHLDIACNNQRYLRLQWLKPEQHIKIKQIKGYYYQQGVEEVEWENLGKPIIKAHDRWQFNKKGGVPLSRLSLLSPSEGLLYQGRIFSRNETKSDWIWRQDFSQYKIKIADTVLNSEPIEILNGKDKYWQIRLIGETQFTNEQLPEIHSRVQPVKLTYLAQTENDFILAYGNADITLANNNGIKQLLSTLQEMDVSPDKAELGKVTKTTNRIEKTTPLSWKVIGLWLLLLLGTGVMGYMSINLYRQMSK